MRIPARGFSLDNYPRKIRLDPNTCRLTEVSPNRTSAFNSNPPSLSNPPLTLQVGMAEVPGRRL